MRSVPGLKRGRSDARESKPVKPVPERTVDATIEYLSPTLAAMVRLQALTGMRGGELVVMRPVDIDTTGPVWLYTPERQFKVRFVIKTNHCPV